MSSDIDNLTFCLGRIDRNSVVEYLEKYVENPEQSPEIAYPKKSAIAWCSFKTDAEGKYQQGSFRLSPILWAIDVWDKSGAGRGRDFYLNTDEYDEIINAIDRDLQDRNVTGFLAGIYEKIQKEYVRKNFSQIAQENLGFYEYNRYVDEEARDKDEDPVDYADLGKSFFLNDIELMCELIRSGKFGDGNRYEKQVVAYILAGQEKSKGMGNIRRTIISPTEPAENIRRFFEKALRAISWIGRIFSQKQEETRMICLKSTILTRDRWRNMEMRTINTPPITILSMMTGSITTVCW